MTKNKSQHYVPVFYLYNFTNAAQRKESTCSRETKIYHYSFEKQLIQERPLNKIAASSYLYSYEKESGQYDHSLDEEIQQLESRAAIAIQSLSAKYDEAYRHKSKNVAIDNAVIDSVIEMLIWQVKRHPDLISELMRSCDGFLAKNQSTFINSKEMALDVARIAGVKDGVNVIKEELDRKNKIIVCIPPASKAQFLTTDKPFVRINSNGPNGISCNGTEMLFPLTSKMLLYMNGNGQRKEFRLEQHRDFIRQVNKCISSGATRYIFGSNDLYLKKIVGSLGYPLVEGAGNIKRALR